MIRHVVLMKFEEEGVAEEAAKRLNALKGTFDGLIELEAGADEEHSKKSYDLAYIVLFRDRAAQDAFDQHPAHLEAQSFIRSHPRTVVKADYTVNL